MPAKQIEKCYNTIISLHRDNIDYWTNVEKDVMKTVESMINHQEQIRMFTKLPVSHLKITQKFPDIKEQLLHRLHDLSLQFESRLVSHVDKLSAQSEAVADLCSRCLEESLTMTPASVTETRPGELSLASKVETCYRLSRLYSSVEIGLTSWLENRHSEKQVWRIKEELSKVMLL